MNCFKKNTSPTQNTRSLQGQQGYPGYPTYPVNQGYQGNAYATGFDLMQNLDWLNQPVGLGPKNTDNYYALGHAGGVASADVNYGTLPQSELDALLDDGPVSIAAQIRPKLLGIRPVRPCPDTRQYIHREYARKIEKLVTVQPSNFDIRGWVQACIDPDAGSGISEAELERLHLDHNEDRLVYLCISGWALMMWRSEEDFDRGIYGAKDAPRPLAWFDLRKAHNVGVESGDHEVDLAPHRICVSTSEGLVFFRIMYADEVHIWYNALRTIIKEYAIGSIRARDTKHHQEKRWPCACGMARAVREGWRMGERAMAIAFHAYDIDFNCKILLGEIMIMIEEVEAGMRHIEGYAEAHTRDEAIESSLSMISEDELFTRALAFRAKVDKDGNGEIRKDEFIRLGQMCLTEALGYHYYADGGDPPGDPGDVCSVM